MKAILVVLFVLAAMAVGFLTHHGGTPARADSASGESLSIYMYHMQQHAQKLGLAIDAQNGELADFYMDELGEMVKYISTKFPEYDGHQVGALMNAMLPPYLTPLGKSIEARDWPAANPAYDAVLTNGCNGCHTATQHAFVKIKRVKSNPFGQDF